MNKKTFKINNKPLWDIAKTFAFLTLFFIVVWLITGNAAMEEALVAQLAIGTAMLIIVGGMEIYYKYIYKEPVVNSARIKRPSI